MRLRDGWSVHLRWFWLPVGSLDQKPPRTPQRLPMGREGDRTAPESEYKEEWQ